MKKQSTRRQQPRRSRSLTLPELQHSKSAVLNSLGSLESRRAYQHAMDEFIAWYCSEPRLALNRAVVLRYRLYLESMPLAPATINVRLAAIRRPTVLSQALEAFRSAELRAQAFASGGRGRCLIGPQRSLRGGPQEGRPDRTRGANKLMPRSL